MNREQATRVAVIGAGPAGCTAAALLARNGASVMVLDDGKRPELIVGESLVPMLVEVFRALGIEDEVRALGVHKPGVTFTIDEAAAFELSFEAVRGVLPTYSYNVPRQPFDALIQETAKRSGARLVSLTAGLTTGGDGREVALDAATLAAIPEWQGEQPDFLVDASGRRRLLAKHLGLKAVKGRRVDVAHFAHYEGCEIPQPAGQVIIGRMREGWSWQIPLPNQRLSVGVVIDKTDAQRYGSTGEAQLEGLIDADPRLSLTCRGRRRVSNLATYANYQLTSERAYGPGWAAVGDAFGFVDPMLSPGLCMAMLSAFELAKRLPARGGVNGSLEDGLRSYEAWFAKSLRDWQSLIDYFYDGRIFAIYKSGLAMSARHPGKPAAMIERHISRNLAGMASGAYTSRFYSKLLLKALGRFGKGAFAAKDFAIR